MKNDVKQHVPSTHHQQDRQDYAREAGQDAEKDEPATSNPMVHLIC